VKWIFCGFLHGKKARKLSVTIYLKIEDLALDSLKGTPGNSNVLFS